MEMLWLRVSGSTKDQAGLQLSPCCLVRSDVAAGPSQLFDLNRSSCKVHDPSTSALDEGTAEDLGWDHSRKEDSLPVFPNSENHATFPYMDSLDAFKMPDVHELLKYYMMELGSDAPACALLADASASLPRAVYSCRCVQYLRTIHRCA